MQDEILCGTLYEVNDTDRILTVDATKVRPRGDHPHVLLQQTDLAPHGNVSCGYTAAFRCAADAYPLTDDDKPKAMQAWRDGWAAMLRDGKVVPGFGARFADCVDYARRAWNSAFPDRKVVSYRGACPRFDLDDPTHLAFYRATANGYMAQIGRYVNKELTADAAEDGIIQDDAKPTGPGVYGHSACVKADAWLHSITALDNYPKTLGAANAYVLDDFEEKVKNGQVMPSFYIFLPA